MKFLLIFISINQILSTKPRCSFYFADDFLFFDLKAINKAREEDKIIVGQYQKSPTEILTGKYILNIC